MGVIPSLKFNPPKRSNFDLSHVWRGSMQPGTVNVTNVERVVPGDSLSYKVRTLVKTFPLRGPLMGRYVINSRFFFVPMRLYTPAMRTNMPTPTSVGDFGFPTFQLDGAGNGMNTPETVKNFRVDPTSLISQLGIPGGFLDTTTRNSSINYPLGQMKFNAIPLLGYYDIIRNFYINPQEPNFFMHTNYWLPGTSNFDPEIRIESMSVEDLDKVYAHNTFASSGNWGVNGAGSVFAKILSPSNGYGRGYFNGRQVGLVRSTYRPDYFTQFLSQTAYDNIREQGGVVNVENGSFSIDQFRMANKLTKLAERAGIVGGRFGEFIRATFGVSTQRNLDIPEYLGGTSQYLNFEDVMNQSGPTGSDATSSNTALGALGGKGTSYNSSGTFKVDVNEYGYIMCLTTITPIPDYHQGISDHLNDLYFSDLFNPMVDRLGFQPLKLSAMYAQPMRADNSNAESTTLTNVDPRTLAIGYQPAWLDYMTRYNEVHGDLSNDNILRYWVTARDFDASYYYPKGTLDQERQNTFPMLKDLSLTSYVLPHAYTKPFVDESVSAHNFFVQIAFDTFAKRPISKKLMPNIG